MTQIQDLKLIALDAEDLAVLSAHLQDAVLKVEDIAYLPAEKRFAAVANRFNWPAALGTKGAKASKSGSGHFTRHRCALRFEQVTNARLRGIDLAKRDQVLSMLAIQFEPAGTDDPSGAITIVFAGGGAIRLDVDYVEAELRDLGGAWAAKSRPSHDAPDAVSGGDDAQSGQTGRATAAGQTKDD